MTTPELFLFKPTDGVTNIHYLAPNHQLSFVWSGTAGEMIRVCRQGFESDPRDFIPTSRGELQEWFRRLSRQEKHALPKPFYLGYLAYKSNNYLRGPT